ncbi:MAG: hypothetical protein EOP70_18955, partial [Variovorax sp.]
RRSAKAWRAISAAAARILAPKGTPQPVVDLLNQKIAKVVNDPAVKTQWAKSGLEGLTMTPAGFTQFLNQDIAKWQKIVESARITVE